MQRKSGMITAIVLVGLLLLQSFEPVFYAQDASQVAPQNVAPPTADQLDQLLAPIALYPDALLAQITSASTNPQEILDVNNWLAENPTLTGQAAVDAAQKQGFDPAFLALVTFPTVLNMMADNIDDYASIGLAVTANQQMVSDSIQRLRARAYAAGSLQTNQQQRVEVQQTGGQTVYIVQPANPEVVYVPQYNPTVVYVQPASPPVAPLVTFAIGVGIGALIASDRPWGWNSWGWGWGHGGGIYYNRGPWGGFWAGGYRPPHYYYRPRPPYYAGRPGYGGNWGYRPPNYRPPFSNRPPSYRPPGNYPGNPGYRPPANKPYPRPYQPGGNNRPGNNIRPGQPGNNYRPGQPGNNLRPGQPGNNYRPGQPSNNNRPSQPGNNVRPGQPGNSYRPGQPGNNYRPGGNAGNKPGTTPSRPGGNPGTPQNQNRPSMNPGGTRPQPSAPSTHPEQTSRPAPQSNNRPQPQNR